MYASLPCHPTSGYLPMVIIWTPTTWMYVMSGSARTCTWDMAHPRCQKPQENIRPRICKKSIPHGLMCVKYAPTPDHLDSYYWTYTIPSSAKICTWAMAPAVETGPRKHNGTLPTPPTSRLPTHDYQMDTYYWAYIMPGSAMTCTWVMTPPAGTGKQKVLVDGYST